MSRAVPDRLRDIPKAIDRCQAYRAPMTSADRSLSAMAEDAVLRNIGVIGEVVNHLPDDLARRHPEVDWAAIVGMRNASGRSMTHPVLPEHHSHELCQVLVASIRAS